MNTFKNFKFTIMMTTLCLGLLFTFLTHTPVGNVFAEDMLEIEVFPEPTDSNKKGQGFQEDPETVPTAAAPSNEAATNPTNHSSTESGNISTSLEEIFANGEPTTQGDIPDNEASTKKAKSTSHDPVSQQHKSSDPSGRTTKTPELNVKGKIERTPSPRTSSQAKNDSVSSGPEVVLVESTNSNDLHYPLLISEGKGYRIDCQSQSMEEAVIHGLGFAMMPSRVHSPLDEKIVQTTPLSHPKLCPSSPDHTIEVFAFDHGQGMQHYLKFPDQPSKFYKPGCKGLTDALTINLSNAVPADPTPFASGGIHTISCNTGAPVVATISTFTDWCMKSDLSSDERPAVEALMELTPPGVKGLGNKAQCREANQFLSQLITIDLENRRIQSLTPLLTLKDHFRQLIISNNPDIGDAYFSAVAQLIDLEELTANNIGISTLAPLAVVKKLKTLKASNNKIENIRHIGSLLSLTILELTDNRIEDASTLENMKALTKVDLQRNQIATLGMEVRPHLQLQLDGNPVAALAKETADITFAEMCKVYQSQPGPKGHTVRKILESTGKQTCDEAAYELAAKKTLELSGKEISDISPITYLRNLTEIDLSDNQILNIEGMAPLTNLNILNLSGNPIASLEGIQDLHSLEELDVSNAKLTKEGISYLFPEDLPNLRVLKTNGNPFNNLFATLDIVPAINTAVAGSRKIGNHSLLGCSYSQCGIAQANDHVNVLNPEKHCSQIKRGLEQQLALAWQQFHQGKQLSSYPPTSIKVVKLKKHDGTVLLEKDLKDCGPITHTNTFTKKPSRKKATTKKGSTRVTRQPTQRRSLAERGYKYRIDLSRAIKKKHTRQIGGRKYTCQKGSKKCETEIGNKTTANAFKICQEMHKAWSKTKNIKINGIWEGNKNILGKARKTACNKGRTRR